MICLTQWTYLLSLVVSSSESQKRIFYIFNIAHSCTLYAFWIHTSINHNINISKSNDMIWYDMIWIHINHSIMLEEYTINYQYNSSISNINIKINFLFARLSPIRLPFLIWTGRGFYSGCFWILDLGLGFHIFDFGFWVWNFPIFGFWIVNFCFECRISDFLNLDCGFWFWVWDLGL